MGLNVGQGVNNIKAVSAAGRKHQVGGLGTHTKPSPPFPLGRATGTDQARDIYSKTPCTLSIPFPERPCSQPSKAQAQCNKANNLPQARPDTQGNWFRIPQRLLCPKSPVKRPLSFPVHDPPASGISPLKE